MSAMNKSARRKASRKQKGKMQPIHRAPAASNRSARQRNNKSIRYRETERIATVTGSVAFAVVNNIACNPGLSGSFPWLSGHAQLYERYKVHKLVYRFKNLKGTSSAGNILMSFDLDTLDLPPSTAIEVTQSTFYSDGAPWRIFEMRVKPDPNRPLFTRSASIGSADAKTYDFGRLFVSAEGCADTSDHGYIEVDYDIELFEKQTGSSTSGGPGDFALWNLSAVQAASSTTVTVAFDEEPITNTLTLVNVAGTFTVPLDGVYEVHLDLTCNTAGSGATPTTIQVDDAAVVPPILCSSTAGGDNDIHAIALLDLNAGQTIRVRFSGTSTAVLAADGCRILVKLLSIAM